MMKTTIKTLFAAATLALATASPFAFASGGESVPLDSANVNLRDTPSLQRGARNFVTYCLNCHSAEYMRYRHLTQIGLTEEQIKTNLMFTTDKIGDAMKSSLDPKDAKEWFGKLPPDLTLVARVRGADWLYTYLRGYYRDDKSPTGWNNRVFPNVGMPHVLHELQGTQAKVKVGERKVHGHEEPIYKIALETPGTLSPVEYDLFVRDLVNYLTFMGEPVRSQRTQMGVLVLFFLTAFFFLALWLKHEYWKDVE